MLQLEPVFQTVVATLCEKRHDAVVVMDNKYLVSVHIVANLCNKVHIFSFHSWTYIHLTHVVTSTLNCLVDSALDSDDKQHAG